MSYREKNGPFERGRPRKVKGVGRSSSTRTTLSSRRQGGRLRRRAAARRLTAAPGS